MFCFCVICLLLLVDLVNLVGSLESHGLRENHGPKNTFSIVTDIAFQAFLTAADVDLNSL